MGSLYPAGTYPLPSLVARACKVAALLVSGAGSLSCTARRPNHAVWQGMELLSWGGGEPGRVGRGGVAWRRSGRTKDWRSEKCASSRAVVSRVGVVA